MGNRNEIVLGPGEYSVVGITERQLRPFTGHLRKAAEGSQDAFRKTVQALGQDTAISPLPSPLHTDRLVIFLNRYPQGLEQAIRLQGVLIDATKETAACNLEQMPHGIARMADLLHTFVAVSTGGTPDRTPLKAKPAEHFTRSGRHHLARRKQAAQTAAIVEKDPALYGPVYADLMAKVDYLAQQFAQAAIVNLQASNKIGADAQKLLASQHTLGQTAQKMAENNRNLRGKWKDTGLAVSQKLSEGTSAVVTDSFNQNLSSLVQQGHQVAQSEVQSTLAESGAFMAATATIVASGAEVNAATAAAVAVDQFALLFSLASAIFGNYSTAFIARLVATGKISAQTLAEMIQQQMDSMFDPDRGLLKSGQGQSQGRPSRLTTAQKRMLTVGGTAIFLGAGLTACAVSPEESQALAPTKPAVTEPNIGTTPSLAEAPLPTLKPIKEPAEVLPTVQTSQPISPTEVITQSVEAVKPVVEQPQPEATPTSYPLVETTEVGIGGAVSPEDPMFTPVRMAPPGQSIRTINGGNRIVAGDEQSHGVFMVRFEWSETAGWQGIDENGRLTGPIDYRRVNAPDGVNVRREPVVTPGNEVGLSPQGTELLVLGEEGGWTEVLRPDEQGTAFVKSEFLGDIYNNTNLEERNVYDLAHTLATTDPYWNNGPYKFEDIVIVEGRNPKKPLIVAVGGKNGFTQNQALLLAETAEFTIANSATGARVLENVAGIMKIPSDEEKGTGAGPDYLGDFKNPQVWTITMKTDVLDNPDNYGLPGGLKGKNIGTFLWEGGRISNYPDIGQDKEVLVIELQAMKEIQKSLNSADWDGLKWRREWHIRNAQAHGFLTEQEMNDLIAELASF